MIVVNLFTAKTHSFIRKKLLQIFFNSSLLCNQQMSLPSTTPVVEKLWKTCMTHKILISTDMRVTDASQYSKIHKKKCTCFSVKSISRKSWNWFHGKNGVKNFQNRCLSKILFHLSSNFRALSVRWPHYCLMTQFPFKPWLATALKSWSESNSKSSTLYSNFLVPKIS